MREVLRKIIRAMAISNHLSHILCVFLMSIVLGWQGGMGAIIALEYKDVQRGGWECWDWLDVLAGAIGCIIGGTIHWIIFKHW